MCTDISSAVTGSTGISLKLSGIYVLKRSSTVIAVKRQGAFIRTNTVDQWSR